MNSVSEQIDERILRLLGLDDVFDLDYDTYLTLLKEAIVTGANKIPQEELALLANERKRVRGRKGRFKPKKEKITADKIATTKFLKPTKKTLALPASISKPADSSQNLSGFVKPLQSIAKTLSAILKFNKKSKEDERKDKESEKRTKREEGLEGFKKGISAVSGATRKLLAPFQSIIDRIWKFIFFTLLGRAFTQLMEWLGDPKNKRKIEVLGRFLKDWWPSLAFAAGLFLTPFGKFIRTTIGALRTFLPQIATLLTNPVFLTVAGSVAAGTAGASLESNLKKVDETLLQKKIQESKERGKPLSQQEIEKLKLEQLQKRVQDIRGTNIPGSALASGGIVPGFSMGGINFGTGYDGIDGSTGQKVSGFGPDTQMIAAQPGEIVMNKKTVDAIGADNLLAMNRRYGGPGANKPKMGRMYNTGGMVGMQGGGNSNRINRSSRKNQEMRLGGSLIDISPIDTKLPRPMTGFRDLAEVQYQNNRGVKGLEGGGLIKNSSRSAWDALNTVKTPLKYAIGDAKKRLFDLEGFKNRNIDNNVRPWWQRLNPFSDKRTFADKLPGNPIENYRMPGFDLKRWRDLRNFRESPDPYKPNPKNPKIKYAPGERYIRPGIDRPLMLQGGGEVEALEKTYIQGQKSGMSSEVLKAIGDEAFLLKNFGVGGTWRNFKGSGASNMRGEPLPRKQSGGLIKENTGMNIPGATADRQLAALHPGEFVITAGAVSKFGIDFFEKINSVDYDSNAAKFGKKSINRPSITPLPRAGMGGVMTLPPITQSAAGSPGSGSVAGSKVPSFSTVSPSGGEERFMNASIYGIVG